MVSKVCMMRFGVRQEIEKTYRRSNYFTELCLRKPSSATELRRKQTTAVVLLGVIGAEFGQEVGTNGTKSAPRRHEDRRKSSIVEGFGIGNNDLARLTSTLSISSFIYLGKKKKNIFLLLLLNCELPVTC